MSYGVITPEMVNGFRGEITATWHDSLDTFFQEVDLIARQRRFNAEQTEAALSDWISSEIADEYRDWAEANRVS